MEALNVRDTNTFRIDVKGLVQGVGFRPYIYRLAHQTRLSGWVENRNDGVVIQLNGTTEEIELFRKALLERPPPASDIESVKLTRLPFSIQEGFIIRQSDDVSEHVTEISPDIAVCPECLSDLSSQPHRINYPFINCTHCGPRFTIIRDLPYDRPHTTMDPFPMCPECKAEYEHVADRRFHAQPVACNHCGPEYQLEEGGNTFRLLDEILAKTASGIAAGHLYAVKGLGGFHLMCDAFNELAVARLRYLKERDGKPFALMFRSLEEARGYAVISHQEEQLLTSWRRPIVLMKRKDQITPGIADGLSTLGMMLPYMPFHHLLFNALETPGIVLTSGNLADEPILISNQEAEQLFGDKVDGIIHYNRDIFNRVDDSVAMVINDAPQLLRRSRGYAPAPIRTAMNTEGIFAAGAELVNAFAMGKGKHVFMSQYIGDLKNFETYRFYQETYERYTRLFRFRPGLLVHDLHPDYLSTRFVNDLSREAGGIPLLPVQHHHAHIASVMVNRGLEGEVIGFSFDGLGLGTDGKLWGGEVMVTGYSGYKRLYHFEYMPLPGGDMANKEPWRMALAYLYKCYGPEFQELPLSFLKEVGEREVELITGMIDRSLNTPLISSAGRLFDAVAAILGLKYRATYQAEAPMKLEAIADPTEKGTYAVEIGEDQVSFQPMIRSIVEDISSAKSSEKISGRFHNTLVGLIQDLANRIRKQTGLNRIVLSGGSFQNRILTGKLCDVLPAEGFDLYLPDKVPVNDQGIALGQLAIGAAKMERV